MKTGRIERLLRLIQGLESGRSPTVEELAELTGVSRRTVFRDLRLLDRAGIRYTYDRDTRRYAAERAVLLPPVTMSHAETLALMLAARHMLSSPVSPDAAAAASASLKLESILPAAIQDHCGPLMEHIEFQAAPASDSAAVRDSLSILQSAVAQHKKLQVRYDSYYEGRAIDVVLHPYRVAYIHRGWYLIAFTEGIACVRTYKVERILRLRMRDDSYTLDRKFSLDDYFGNAWLMIRGDEPYHVKIRFLKQVAANVDEIAWHKTQKTVYCEDGSLVFEADVDGIDEISWWVLGYGDQAQVMEPPELRSLIAERAKRMCAYYNRHDDEAVSDRT